MLQRRKAPKMGVREPPQLRSPSHLKWVRGHQCALYGGALHICEGRMEAHHVREGSNGGMGLKPDDSDAVPLCSLAHRTFHSIGAASFRARYLIDLPKLAAELWAKSPHRNK